MKDIIICDRSNHKEASRLCKKYGVSVNIDMFSEPDVFDVYLEEISKNLMSYSDVEIVSIHGPYKDLCLGSKDKLIKSATMARFEYAYKISTLMNCPNVILHHGYIPGTSSPSYWAKRAETFFIEFLKGKDNRISLHLENQFEHTPDLILEVVSAVNDKIGFVHLHNNNGLEDQHLDFTSGSIDFKEICFALEKYAPNCIWGIETNSLDDTEKSIQWLIDNHYLNEK